MEPVRPDLAGPCITGIVPGLLGSTPPAWFPAPTAGASATVLLVLDGLGWTELERHRAILPNLTAMVGGSITTVVPSTTSTALTSIVTGRAPIEHGVLGYRVREGSGVLNVLQWRMEDGGRAPEPRDLQRHAAFGGRRVPVVTQASFRRTGFTRAHLEGVDFVGWSTVAVLVEQCRGRIAAGAPFVYAYYPGVDSVAHEFGLHDDRYLAELAFTDRLVGWMLDVLPAHAALLVTADHGQAQVGPEGWVELPTVAGLAPLQAGDGRFRHLHARPGGAGDLLLAAREAAGDRAWVLTRRELLDAQTR